MNEQQAEYFDVVDTTGTVIGTATRKECHSDKTLIHRTVHVIVLNLRGHIYMQKRADDKDIQPGKWDTSVGGHVASEETVEHALKRELYEELGISIKNTDPVFLYEYLWQSDVETELVTTFKAVYEGPVRIQHDEISQGRFWTRDEIRTNLGKGIFTPNFEAEFGKFEETLCLQNNNLE